MIPKMRMAIMTRAVMTGRRMKISAMFIWYFFTASKHF